MVDNNVNAPKISKMEEKRERKQNKVLRTLRYLYKEAWAYRKGRVIALPFYILLTVLAPLCLLFIPSLAVTYLGGESKDAAAFCLILGGILLAYIVISVVSIYMKEILIWNNTFVRLRRFLKASGMKGLTCDYAFFDNEELKRKKGQACSSLWANDTGAESVLQNFPELIIGILGLLIYLCYSGYVSLWLLLILLLMALSDFVLSLLANRWYENHATETSQIMAENYSFREISESTAKGKDIRNYSLGKLFYEIFGKRRSAYAKALDVQVRFLFLPNLSNTVFGFVRDLVGYGVLVYGVVNGRIEIASFALMVGILNGVSTYITQICQSFDTVLTGSKDTCLFLDFLDEQSQFKGEEGLKASFEWSPKIEFDDVTFTYPGTEKPILEHLNFEIKPGEKVALVGENGAGKSSIVKLLSLFYAPTSGQIRINGTDILDFDAKSYRQNISVVNQEVNLIAVDLDQFVSCEIEPDNQRVEKALREAGLYEKVQSLPKKEKSPLTKELDKDGIDLSGGQTQLLILARALYRNGSILLLDEPTSALDPIAEGKLYEKYGELTKGKTSIFISHRLSSTRFCDRILYLENGSIKEEGTHEELMALNGEYAKIFELQAHYYRESESGEEVL